jgi:hypothetical protein
MRALDVDERPSQHRPVRQFNPPLQKTGHKRASAAALHPAAQLAIPGLLTGEH